MSSRFFMGCIVAFVVLFVSGIGYRVYTDYVDEIKTKKLIKENIGFLEKSEQASAEKRTLDKDRQSQQVVPTPAESNVPGVTIGETKRDGKTPQSAVKVRYANMHDTLTPDAYTTSEFVYISASQMATQYVETPDGKKHSVFRPAGKKYELKHGSFMSPSLLSTARRKVIIDGVTYKVPDGEDVDAYIDKIHLSSMYSVPLGSVESLIEEGVIPSSPIEAQYDPLLAPSAESQPMDNSAAELGGFEDTDTATVGSDVPVSPSDLPNVVKPTPSPPSVSDLEKQLTPQGIEAELRGELSTDPFDRTQQLIDQYGTEEGLRRLREMDPDAARRFERERRGAPKDDDYSDVQSPDDSP